MALSTVGSVRFTIYAVLLLVNTSILAVSSHVNAFQKFFYKADVFPFALSLVTMVFMLAMIFMDLKFKNVVTARPPFELGWLALFGTLWLMSNAFSTNRWKYASPSLCRTIPSTAQYAPYRTWCSELQALRVLIWIEWTMFLLTFAYLLLWTITQYNNGRLDVWYTAFSQDEYSSDTRRRSTDSEFLQWEKFPRRASASLSPPVGYLEHVRDSYDKESWQGQGDQYDPHYSHPPESNYTQSPKVYYTPASETQYTPWSQGPHPVEVPYLPHPLGQYVPSSQTQATRYAQPYFSGTEHLF